MADELAQRLQALFSRPSRPGGRPPTLRETSQATGISVSYLWRLKAGRTRNPTREVLTKLAGFFGVPVAYFTCEAGQVPGPPPEPAQSFHELVEMARSRLRLRDVEGALRALEQARRSAGPAQDPAMEGQLAIVRARALAVKGELEQARRCLADAMAVFPSPESGPPWADAALAMASLAYYEGRYHDAYLEARHVLAMLEKKGWKDDALRFTALVGTGSFARRVGRLAEFLDHYQAALELARKMDEPVFLATALNGVGLALVDLGRAGEALSYLEQSADRYRELRVPVEVARVQHNLGLALECLGRWQDAVEILTKSLGILEVFHEIRELTYVRMELGWCYARLGLREKALQHACWALDTARAHGWQAEAAWAWLHLGQVYRELGELEHSRAALQAAVELFGALNLRPEWALASADYGDLLAQTGQVDEALKAYRMAVETLLPPVMSRHRLVLRPASSPDGSSAGSRESEDVASAPGH